MLSMAVDAVAEGPALVPSVIWSLHMGAGMDPTARGVMVEGGVATVEGSASITEAIWER